MGFKKEYTGDIFLKDTSVENIFINEYLANAPGNHVKVFLYALMRAELHDDFDNNRLAKQLGMEIEDVLAAWTYWEKQGAIRKIHNNPQDITDYDVEFISLKSMLYGQGEETEAPATFTSAVEGMSDTAVREMFSSVEKILGRILSSTETMEISSWINDFSVTPDVIAHGFEYCGERNKKDIRYVGAVIKRWAMDGYRTLEDVQKHIAEDDKRQHRHRRIFQALGFNRNPGEEERKIMDSWFDEMGFELDKVLEACGKTSGISSPSINYVNKVLSNWTEGKGKPHDPDEVTTSDIMNYYEELRAGEEAEAAARRDEVYSKVPKIREIEKQTNSLSREISRIIISDDVEKKEKTEKIRDTLEGLNMERAILLTDNGFDLDYMDVRYECPECKDTGVLETGEKCQCFGQVTKEKIQLLKQKYINA